MNESSARGSVHPAQSGRADSWFSTGWMSRRYLALLVLVLAILIGAAGCLSTTVHEVTYEDGDLEITVESTDEPVENAVLLVTVMKVEAFEQNEVYRKPRYIDLDRGLNVYTVPVDLQPGSYKIFLTIFVGNERRASVIRDLEVAP